MQAACFCEGDCMNRRFFMSTAALFVLFAILFTGCSAIAGSDSGSSKNSKLNADGTVSVNFNVYDDVLATRSILPEVKAGSLYFTVVATNNAGTWGSGSQNADGDDDSITDVVYWQWVKSGTVTAGVPTDDIVLNLKAGEYWRITAYGTSAAGTTLGADATLAEKKAAISSLKTKTVVKGKICFYAASTGTLYEIDSSLNTATPSGTEKTDLTIATSASTDSGENGTVCLPVKPETGTGITYIKVTYTGRELNGSTPTHADTVVSSGITLGSIYEITDTTTFTPGIYDVTVLFGTSSATTDVVYTWPETLTVWSNNESTWFNTVSGTYDDDGTGSDHPYYFDVSAADIDNYKAKTKYVSATTNTGLSNHLPAGSDTAGNGSIFAPYATVEKAVESCKADGTKWQILVDGTSTNTALETVSGSTLSGVYVTSSAAATAETTDDLIITVRRFAANAAEVTNSGTLNASKPVFYVSGANTTFTLQNITVTGLVTVATNNFIMDNATISGDVSLAAVGNFITIAVSDTTSKVGSLYPAYYTYSPVVLHAKDNSDGSKPLTEAWLTTMAANGFTLNSTTTTGYTAVHPLAVLGVDQKSGSGSLGDIVLKRKTTVGIDSNTGNDYTVTMSAATTSWTHAGTWTDTITDAVTISISDTSTSPVTAVTSGVTNIIGTLYTTEGKSISTATAGSGITVDSTTSMTPTFTLPGYITGADAGSTYTLEVTYMFNNVLYGGNITLTIN